MSETLRDLDEQVAREAMGSPELSLETCPCPDCGGPLRYAGTRARCVACSEWYYSPYPEYSSDIALAFEVVAKMRERYPNARFRLEAGRCWWAHYGDEFAAGDTPAEAICQGALRALVWQRVRSKNLPPPAKKELR